MNKLFFFFLIIIPILSYSQKKNNNYSTSSKKAIKYYEESGSYINSRQFKEAEASLQKAVERAPEFVEARLRLANIFKINRQHDLAEHQYMEIANLHPKNKRYVSVYFNLGDYAFRRGDYVEANKKLSLYVSLRPRSQKTLEKAKRLLANTEFALANKVNVQEFNPRPVGGQMNKYEQQYFPVLTVDQNNLIFVRREGDEDIMISRRTDNSDWEQPEFISPNVSSDYNEGTCTVSADGRMLVFTSCRGRKGYGSCDLYVSYKEGDDWSEPKNMGKGVNTSAWESQPALTSDGRTMYFVSNRTGGVGNRDIWKTHMIDRDSWTQPENLGETINTKFDDISPFIHPNGRTMYFGANGRVGFGGFDIYISELDTSGWSQPVNMGYPINTHNDEVSMFITADGKKGYYSYEVLEKNIQSSKIYEIDIPKTLQTKYRSGFVKGIVSDATNGDRLKAEISLINIALNEEVSYVESDSINGEYFMVLTEGAEYGLYVEKEGYLFQSLYFDFKSDSAYQKPIRMDITLDPIAKGVSTTLNNVFFGFDSYALTNNSKSELSKVVKFLILHNNITITVKGHTDNDGNENYNMALSRNRAKAVCDFMIKNGIEKSRLKYEGKGAAEPVATNNTEEGKAKNRRIEFMIN